MVIEINNQALKSSQVSESAAANLVIDESAAGQRIDNFLLKVLKGVPKSHVYRILRSGEVRVNKKRIDADFRLNLEDVVRVPPIRVSAAAQSAPEKAVQSKFDDAVIYEDDAILVINKPAGFAVHGGSGVSRGVIEQLRLERPHAKFLELVHRLDRDTSGVLMLAKKRSALVALHEAIRNNHIDKRYIMMVHGHWQEKKKHVILDLQKYVTNEGERRVNVVTDLEKDKHHESQVSETIFYLSKNIGDFSLLEAKLITGRTHQLRVQLAHLGFPILGDDKYGNFALNKSLMKQGLKRMFLHSSETNIRHPLTGDKLKLSAPLPVELTSFIKKVESSIE
ncbi:MAG TPA: RNA pseudouridine synthase [Methylophilaceae bacterium]|nr:RNA pseudouridine synthase [Methylophilaceae bacterium]HAJ70730.1 RNA pseudouridine synthase [Methylophilaceae bacterium]